jgi:hypothetical protein
VEHRAQNNDVLDGAGAADLGALTGAVRTVIEESLSDLRLQVHRDVQSMHVDLIRQFQIQKVDPTSTTLRINPSVPTAATTGTAAGTTRTITFTTCIYIHHMTSIALPPPFRTNSTANRQSTPTTCRGS